MLGAEYTIGVIVLIAVLAGVASWGIVQFVRGAVRSYRKNKGLKKEVWWWNSSLRVLAITVGALTGGLLAPDIWGYVIGACAGILNTTMVAFVKSKLKNAGESAGLDLGGRSDSEDSIDEELEGIEDVDRESMGH